MDSETSESMEDNDSLYALKNEKRKKKLSGLSHYKRSNCQYCSLSVVSNNLRRHERRCEENSNAFKPYTCEKCCMKFFRLDSLRSHTIACSTSNKNFSFRHCCLHKQCTERFCFKTAWIEHMQNKHNFKIQSPKIIKFDTVPEFYKWKNEEEDRTQSYYTQQSGGTGRRLYFYCQHDDTMYKRNPPKTSRRLRVGSVKEGKRCMSMMHLNIKGDGTCSVKYFPTHSHAWNEETLSQQLLPDEETDDYVDSPTAVGVTEESTDSVQYLVPEVKDEGLNPIIIYRPEGEGYTDSSLIDNEVLSLESFVVEEVIISENGEQSIVLSEFNISCAVDRLKQRRLPIASEQSEASNVESVDNRHTYSSEVESRTGFKSKTTKVPVTPST